MAENYRIQHYLIRNKPTKGMLPDNHRTTEIHFVPKMWPTYIS